MSNNIRKAAKEDKPGLFIKCGHCHKHHRSFRKVRECAEKNPRKNRRQIEEDAIREMEYELSAQASIFDTLREMDAG